MKSVGDPQGTQEALSNALAGFADAPLRQGAVALLNSLGYESDFTDEVGDVNEFLDLYEAKSKLKDGQQALFDDWLDVELVFQVTDEEIARGGGRLVEDRFDAGRVKSFVFVAAELARRSYTRTGLAEMTRAVNRLFRMPVVLLFRCEDRCSLAVVHRRAHRRDDNRDVLEKVTLVKDVDLYSPHRAHVDILAELTLPRLVKSHNVVNFDDLHRAWEDTLDAEELNRRFYRELFKWYEQAIKECRFPADGAGEGSRERQVIRLVTRLLFIWFLKEKGLVPDDIFTEAFATSTVKNHAREATDYYRAVLQNLFFATLNTEIHKRAFSTGKRRTHRDFTKYRYRALLTDPDGLLIKLKTVPFVNGGLFDCLDNWEGVNEGGRRIDAFTDNATQGKALHVPASILLDQRDGLFPLLSRFKFTVEENTPLEQEVALDPELLGRVFENLLAAYNPETRNTVRKATGSYYTPRRIVDYMVDEALVAALTQRVHAADGDAGFLNERLRYLLDYEDAFDDAADLFGRDETVAIVRAIANLRVLDPAVGSGAFPMGVLHKLTLALRRLDPKNEHWKRFQIELAKERTTAAFQSHSQKARDVELLEISSTFETYRDSDFGRKLYLIQNSIFGVDIQPIACQIARLRFFISLAVEQQPNRDPDNNYGIRPLPNLETRFVAADSLLSTPKQPGLATDRKRDVERQLARNRERHFSAFTREAKRASRAIDKKLRRELASALAEGGLDDVTAARIAAWDPYDQNSCANWFDAEYMFGVQDGFDMVIGNPPYVQLQRNSGELGRLYKDEGYETFAGTGDVYQLFCERGMKLLAKGAHLAYITSNSWLRAKYGEAMRAYLSRTHTPRRLLEVGKDIFDSAIVDTSILVVQEGRERNEGECLAIDMDSLEDKTFPPETSSFGTLHFGGKKSWIPMSSLERGIMDKMLEVGTPLKEWDISIYRGVLTGYNTAFIVDQAARDELIRQDPRSAELLKPILRGRDIRPYRAQWAGLWLIDTHNGYDTVPPVDVLEYPAIKRHLDRHLTKLAKRQDRGRTPYNLRNCAYHEQFEEEKLCWMHMSPIGRFSLVDGGVYCNQKTFMIVGQDLNYLCAVLNSTVVTKFVRSVAVTTGMGLTQWDKFVVTTIPVPIPRVGHRTRLTQLVDQLVRQHFKENTQIAMEIDKIVFDLYGLDRSEREFVLRAAQ